MTCQQCNERPAAVYFTQVINGEKTTVQLCERCAHEKGEQFMSEANGFSFNNLIAGLLNWDPAFQSAQSTRNTEEQGPLQCNQCEMTYQQFVKIGKFGCAHCYKTFLNQVTPIIRKVHSGNIKHGGKIPKRIGGSIHLKKEIQSLKNHLQQLVANEEFEQAAKVRDEIRSLEKSLQNEEGNKE